MKSLFYRLICVLFLFNYSNLLTFYKLNYFLTLFPLYTSKFFYFYHYSISNFHLLKLFFSNNITLTFSVFLEYILILLLRQKSILNFKNSFRGSRKRSAHKIFVKKCNLFFDDFKIVTVSFCKIRCF